MEYDDNSVAGIVNQYSLLIYHFQRLKEVKEKEKGAVLGFVVNHYGEADRATKFLRTIPDKLWEELEIGSLEEELTRLANTIVILKS